MRSTKETMRGIWTRELSLVPTGGADEPAFLDACRAVLAINPRRGVDGTALHFAAQGWLAATRHAAASTT